MIKYVRNSGTSRSLAPLLFVLGSGQSEIYGTGNVTSFVEKNRGSREHDPRPVFPSHLLPTPCPHLVVPDHSSHRTGEDLSRSSKTESLPYSGSTHLEVGKFSSTLDLNVHRRQRTNLSCLVFRGSVVRSCILGSDRPGPRGTGDGWGAGVLRVSVPLLCSQYTVICQTHYGEVGPRGGDVSLPLLK